LQTARGRIKLDRSFQSRREGEVAAAERELRPKKFSWSDSSVFAAAWIRAVPLLLSYSLNPVLSLLPGGDTFPFLLFVVVVAAADCSRSRCIRTLGTSSAKSRATRSPRPLSGYYDGTVFHRNIKGFMIQGGDPTGTGKGGTSIWGKKFNDEIRESLKWLKDFVLDSLLAGRVKMAEAVRMLHNARGILSMANSGPNTNGSQFFIAYAKQPHLNGLYTVFGKVIHGFEVLDLMEKTQTGPGDRPLAEIRLNRVTIHANPLAG
ncbi:hypothetical protein Taro_020978, partial [Colocasia esculenta]|nr:hypothetical protein [Colocasia esculenta]